MTDYNERYRPQLHFSPPCNWINDPNGMVYLDGRYHLFYQYHPHSNVWGPMHWGHAFSEDLVHWEHCSVALAPDELGFIWSGSAVHDYHNTSGLGQDGQGPLVCIYTYHHDELERHGNNDHEYQGLAFSNDGGFSWHKYSGNPVLPNVRKSRDFRDPKVFWHNPTNEWIMVIAAGHEVQFWASPNLISWHYRSSFGSNVGAHAGIWECPDLVQVPVAGSLERRWVLIQSLNPGGLQGGSGTQYFVGDFDGTTFSMCESFAKTRPEGTGVWIDHGPDCYAGVTWSNVPAADGRVLFIGWLNNWDYASVVPTDPWRGSMTVVRSLELHEYSYGMRLRSSPVVEQLALRENSLMLFKGQLPGSERTIVYPTDAITPGELELTFNRPKSGFVEVCLHNPDGEVLRLGFDVDKEAFYGDRADAGEVEFSPRKFPRRHWAACAPNDDGNDHLDMRILVDTSSVEVFFNQSEIAYTALTFPTSPYSSVSISASATHETLDVELVLHTMRSIWKTD